MKIAALVVAAGAGKRAGGDLPKQYQPILGQAVLTHTINALLKSEQISEVICVINQNYAGTYSEAIRSITDSRLKPPVETDSQTRTESVRTGLARITSETVLIHDAARPMVPKDALDRLINRLNYVPAAYLAVPVPDALWRVQGKKAVKPEPREHLWRAQTPQAFRTSDIISAHEKTREAANDDVELALNAGLLVEAVLGSERNIKITNPEDFALAEAMMRGKMDIRTGQGFDVHSFTEGDHVMLCGISIPHTKGFLAHSDGDVAMHAITDALFGALAEGDIGQWFPPSDEKWKAAASDIFLQKAMERVAERGFALSNVDCTIICEVPKIGPHAIKMREHLSTLLGIDTDRVSVKATTSEKLGFTGREEGIAAMATATLVSK